MRRIARGVVVLVLLLAGCASDAGDEASPPAGTPLSQEEAAKPGIEITYPAEGGDALPAGEVIVAVTVRSFDVVDKLSKPAKEGQGHVHYYLDVDKLPTKPGKPAVTADKQTYHAAATTSHRWKDIEPGTHTFAVQLVNNDHTPLEPPVTDEVDVRISE